MHNPSTQPRHSIYYDYKVYPYRRAPELDGQQQQYPVVIVGAGPVGLVAALDLARLGVSCVLLESERQVSLGSRAICFTRRSMEILQQAGGVDQPLTATGLPWRYGNSYYRGQRTFRLDMPYDEDDRFYPMLNHQQQYLEEYLVAAVTKQPLIDLRWGHHVTDVVRNDGAGAALRVDTQDGAYEIEADWVVATDGARSGVRSLLGLAMQGDAYEGRFVICDIRVDLDLPTERLAFFDPPWNPGNTVLMHREPHGLWRIDFQLPPGETPEQALALESLAPRIDAQLALIGKAGAQWELDWSSVYSARAMTLTDYRAGRILFSGDAGHMLPIFGVRGANTGWQDCQNLAWKLAFVVKGLASDRLLRSYSQERVGAAWEIIDEASKSTRFMTPPSHGFRLLRDAVLSLSLTQEFVRPLYHWRTSRPHEYLNSNLNATGDDDGKFVRGPRAGAQLDNIKLGDDHYLLDHAGAAFQLIYFGARIPSDVQDQVKALKAGGLPLQLIAVVPANGPAAVDGAHLTLRDASGHCYAKYGASEGAAYLARPDQHVCARWLKADGKGIAAAVKTALAQ